MPSSTSCTPREIDENVDPIVLYSRSLYDYTLNLWTEFQKLAEGKTGEQPPPPASQQILELGDRKSS
jgi:hypothetical protein